MGSQDGSFKVKRVFKIKTMQHQVQYLTALQQWNGQEMDSQFPGYNSACTRYSKIDGLASVKGHEYSFG
jgi:hypothetical protein